MRTPAIAVAAPQSGAGKTTVTMALIAGLRRRGLTVQAFKVGPDYLDPALLTWASGRPCRNLDGWMLPEAHLLELYHRACRGADVAVIEGVMGLFDGRNGAGDAASTAAIARLLDCCLLLVLDASRASRTVGAVALGLARSDPRLRIAGAVLNRVAGDRHRDACAEGLEAFGGTYLGAIRRDPQLELPDRYLGLVSPAEAEPAPGLREALERAAQALDLEVLLRQAALGEAPGAGPDELFPAEAAPPRVRVAVAMDAAFHFYYRDSLDLLSAWGGELVPFSPLEAAALPERVGGVYLGGGYPELFAARLAGNRQMLESLRQANRRGVLVYAECGGAMYASREIEDAEGRHHLMAGLWPASISVRDRRLTIGYRTVRASERSFLAGFELPAHEFHYSRVHEAPGEADAAWTVLGETGPDRPEGFAAAGLSASYIHLHMGARPGLARRFVDACASR